MSTVFACIGVAGVQETPAGPRGTRCRNLVAEFGQTCQEHTGTNSSAVLSPDLVLFRIKINSKQVRKFKDSGVRLVSKSAERESEIFENRGDIKGVNVFGGQIQNISLADILADLADNTDLILSDIHVDVAEDAMSTFIMAFSRYKESLTVPEITEKIENALSEFLSASWGGVLVFANPPRDKDGFIVHTINCAGRKPDIPPAQSLHFAEGLWNVE